MTEVLVRFAVRIRYRRSVMKWLIPTVLGSLVLALAVSLPRAQDTAATAKKDGDKRNTDADLPAAADSRPQADKRNVPEADKGDTSGGASTEGEAANKKKDNA